MRKRAAAQVSRLVNLTHEQNGTWGAETENTVFERGRFGYCAGFCRASPVGLCLMRKRKGRSTVTQGGEDRANKMAAKKIRFLEK